MKWEGPASVAVIVALRIVAYAWFQGWRPGSLPMPFTQAAIETRCSSFGQPINSSLPNSTMPICAAHWLSCARFLYRNIRPAASGDLEDRGRENSEEYTV